MFGVEKMIIAECPRKKAGTLKKRAEAFGFS